MKPSVIIIGAGPGGLTAALTLAQYGIQPYIIEKEKERSQFTKALSIMPRTLEVASNLNVLDAFLERGNRIEKNNFHVGGSHVGSIHYTDLPSKCNFQLALTQPDLEGQLEKRLSDSGIAIHREIECLDVKEENGKTLVEILDHQTQSREVLETDYVIVAEGGRSSLRAKFVEKGWLHLTHERRYQSNFIMGDFVMKDFPLSRSERYTYFNDQLLYALVPMRYPFVRVITFGIRGGEGTPAIEEFQEMTKRVAKLDLKLEQGTWLSRFYPSRFMINKFRVGNTFFLGDAAHIMSPIGAQGINLSIEDAYNLGWKLGMVMQNDLHPKILDRYEIERMEATRCVLKETDGLHKKLSGALLNFILMQQVKLLKRPEIQKMVLQKQTHFYINYPSLNRKRSLKKEEQKELLPGTRCPDGKCDKPVQTTFFDHLPKNKITLVLNYLSSDPKETKERVTPPLLSDYPSIIETCSVKAEKGVDYVVNSPSVYVHKETELYKKLSQSPFYLLIYPDKYMGATFGIEEKEILLNHLREILNLKLQLTAV